jgi:hypothetical protein
MSLFDDIDLGADDYSGEKKDSLSQFTSKPVQKKYQPFGGQMPQAPQPQYEPIDYGYEVQPAQRPSNVFDELDAYDGIKKAHGQFKQYATENERSAKHYEGLYDDFVKNEFQPFFNSVGGFGDFDNDDEMLSFIDQMKADEVKASQEEDGFFGGSSDRKIAAQENLKKFGAWDSTNGLRDKFLRLKAEKDRRRQTADAARNQEFQLFEQLTNIPIPARDAMDAQLKARSASPKSKKATDDLLNQYSFEAPIVDHMTGEVINLERTDPRKAVPSATDHLTGKTSKSFDAQKQRLSAAMRGDINGVLARRDLVKKERNLRDKGIFFSQNGLIDGRPIGLSRNDVDLLDIAEMKAAGMTSYRGKPLELAMEELGGEERLKAAKIMESVYGAKSNYEDAQLAFLKVAGSSKADKAREKMEAARDDMQKVISLAAENGLDNELFEQAESTSWLGGLGNAIQRGVLMSEMSDYTPDFLTNTLDADEMQKFIEIASEIEKLPTSSTMKRVRETKSDGFLDAVGNLLFDNPAAIPEMFVESISAFLPATIKWLIPSAGAGAAVGAIGGPGAALAGAGVGAKVSWGVASFVLEASGMALEGMQELGVDWKNPKVFAAAWTNESIRNKIQKKMVQKGVPIAAADMLAGMMGQRVMGVINHTGNAMFKGGKLLDKTAFNKAQGAVPRFTTFQKTRNAAAELGFDSTMGMSGEYLGQWASKEPGEAWDWDSVVAEGFVGVGPGILSSALEMRGRNANYFSNAPIEISGEQATETGSMGTITRAGYAAPYQTFNDADSMVEYLSGIPGVSPESLEFTNDFLQRMFTAKPEAMASLKVAISPRTPDSNMANRGQFESRDGHDVIYINEKEFAADPMGAFMHESGHFARVFILSDKELNTIWEGLGPDAQLEAYAQYFTKKPDQSFDSLPENEQKKIKQAFDRMKRTSPDVLAEEWFSYQWGRVLTQDGKPDPSVAKQLKSFKDKVLHEAMSPYVGTENLSGGAKGVILDQKIKDFLGMENAMPEPATPDAEGSQTNPTPQTTEQAQRKLNAMPGTPKEKSMIARALNAMAGEKLLTESQSFYRPSMGQPSAADLEDREIAEDYKKETQDPEAIAEAAPAFTDEKQTVEKTLVKRVPGEKSLYERTADKPSGIPKDPENAKGLSTKNKSERASAGGRELPKSLGTPSKREAAAAKLRIEKAEAKEAKKKALAAKKEALKKARQTKPEPQKVSVKDYTKEVSKKVEQERNKSGEVVKATEEGTREERFKKGKKIDALNAFEAEKKGIDSIIPKSEEERANLQKAFNRIQKLKGLMVSKKALQEEIGKAKKEMGDDASISGIISKVLGLEQLLEASPVSVVGELRKVVNPTARGKLPSSQDIEDTMIEIRDRVDSVAQQLENLIAERNREIRSLDRPEGQKEVAELIKLRTLAEQYLAIIAPEKLNIDWRDTPHFFYKRRKKGSKVLEPVTLGFLADNKDYGSYEITDNKGTVNKKTMGQKPQHVLWDFVTGGFDPEKQTKTSEANFKKKTGGLNLKEYTARLEAVRASAMFKKQKDIGNEPITTDSRVMEYPSGFTMDSGANFGAIVAERIRQMLMKKGAKPVPMFSENPTVEEIQALLMANGRSLELLGDPRDSTKDFDKLMYIIETQNQLRKVKGNQPRDIPGFDGKPIFGIKSTGEPIIFDHTRALAEQFEYAEEDGNPFPQVEPNAPFSKTLAKIISAKVRLKYTQDYYRQAGENAQLTNPIDGKPLEISEDSKVGRKEIRRVFGESDPANIEQYIDQEKENLTQNTIDILTARAKQLRDLKTLDGQFELELKDAYNQFFQSKDKKGVAKVIDDLANNFNFIPYPQPDSFMPNAEDMGIGLAKFEQKGNRSAPKLPKGFFVKPRSDYNYRKPFHSTSDKIPARKVEVRVKKKKTSLVANYGSFEDVIKKAKERGGEIEKEAQALEDRMADVEFDSRQAPNGNLLRSAQNSLYKAAVSLIQDPDDYQETVTEVVEDRGHGEFTAGKIYETFDAMKAYAKGREYQGLGWKKNFKKERTTIDNTEKNMARPTDMKKEQANLLSSVDISAEDFANWFLSGSRKKVPGRSLKMEELANVPSSVYSEKTINQLGGGLGEGLLVYSFPDFIETMHKKFGIKGFESQVEGLRTELKDLLSKSEVLRPEDMQKISAKMEEVSRPIVQAVLDAEGVDVYGTFDHSSENILQRDTQMGEATDADERSAEIRDDSGETTESVETDLEAVEKAQRQKDLEDALNAKPKALRNREKVTDSMLEELYFSETTPTLRDLAKVELLRRGVNIPYVIDENTKELFEEVFTPKDSNPRSLNSDAGKPETGKPITLNGFHGSNQAKTVYEEGFDPDKLGSFTGAVSAREGFFFARRPKTARRYSGTFGPVGRLFAKLVEIFERQIPAVSPIKDTYYSYRQAFNNPEQKEGLSFIEEKLFSSGLVNSQGKWNNKSEQKTVDNFLKSLDSIKTPKGLAGNAVQVLKQQFKETQKPVEDRRGLIQASLEFKNPYVVDFKGKNRTYADYVKAIKKAKKDGHDGAVLLNTFDPMADDIYVVFSASQISLDKLKDRTLNSDAGRVLTSDVNPNLTKATLLSKIAGDRELKNEFKEWAATRKESYDKGSFRMNMIDRMSPVKLLSQSSLEVFEKLGLKKGSLLHNWLDVHGRSHQYFGKGGNGLEQSRLDYYDPLTEIMRKHNVTQKEAGEYLIARAAPSKNLQIEAKAEEVLSDMRKEDEQGKGKEYKKLYDFYYDKDGNFIRNSGVETKKALEVMADMESKPEFVEFLKEFLPVYYGMNKDGLDQLRNGELIRAAVEDPQVKGKMIDIDEKAAMVTAASRFDFNTGKADKYGNKYESKVKLADNYAYSPLKGFEGETEQFFDQEEAWEEFGSKSTGAGKGFNQPKTSFILLPAFGRKNDGVKSYGPDPVTVVGNAINQHTAAMIRAKKNEVSRSFGNMYALLYSVLNPNKKIKKDSSEFFDLSTLNRVPEFKETYDILKSIHEPGNEKLLEELTTEFNKVFDKPFEPSETKMAYELKEAESDIAGAKIGLVRRTLSSEFKNDQNVFVFRKAGQPQFIRFNERTDEGLRMADAMNNLRYESLPPILGGFNVGTRLMAKMFTSANLAFILPNFFRDVLTARIHLSEDNKKVLIKDALNRKNLAGFMKSIYQTEADIKNGINPNRKEEISKILALRDPKKILESGNRQAMYQYYKENGGKVDMFRHPTLVEKIKDIQKSLNGKDGWTKASWKKFWDFVDTANTAVENSIRASTFWAAIKDGRGPDEAAVIARNVTVDFNQKGNLTQTFGSLYVFFGASMNSIDRFFTTFSRRSPKERAKLIAGIAGAAFIINILNRLMDDDEDEEMPDYDTISSYKRDTNAILPLPAGLPEFFNDEKDTGFFSLPLPLGYNLFWTMGQVMGDMFAKNVFGRGGAGLVEATTRFTDSALSAFNPVGGSSGLAVAITPTPLVPWIELYANKNFMGSPIRYADRPFEVPKPGHMQDPKGTPEHWNKLSKAINNFMGGSDDVKGSFAGMLGNNPLYYRSDEDITFDISGNQMRHLVMGYLGGPGQKADALFGSLFSAGSGKPSIENVNDVPIVNRFLRATTYGSATRGTFYEVRDAVKNAEKAVKSAKQINAKTYTAVLNDNRELLKLSSSISQLDKQKNKMRRLKKQIEGSKTLTEEQKTQRVDDLQKKELNLMVKVIKQAQSLGIS